MSAANPFRYASSYSRYSHFIRAKQREQVRKLCKEESEALGVVRTAKDAQIADCLIQGMIDKVISKTTGISQSMVEHGINRMKQRAGVTSRVSLAIVLWESRMEPT
jgi:DNA-binding NarL/FixJ family response regulator